jgi:DNA-binding transcriptional LysR family regulator
MARINLRNFDLNLLVIFDALMSERNVTRAAEKVFLSQPAMSHALNRLRTLLDDKILVKTEKGLMPTPRALAMELPVRESINQIQHSLFFPEPFDPSNSQKKFMIHTVEHFEWVILPSLLHRLEEFAPKVGIDLEVLDETIPEAELTNGNIHFAVGIQELHKVPKRLRSQPLLEGSFVIVARKGNPKVADRVSPDQLTELEQVYYPELVNQLSRGSSSHISMVMQWFNENNIKPKFAHRSATYSPAANIVAMTNYIIILPRRIANMMMCSFDLKIAELPENFTKFNLNLIWHPLYEKAPAHIWLRGQLLDLAQKLAE